MRNTFLRSPSLTRADDPSLRFRFVSFEVKMWRRCERPRFTLPVAVFLKRLAAPLCVFSFGISPQNAAVSSQPSDFSKHCQFLDSTRVWPTTRVWRPAPLAGSGWEHCVPQLSPAPSPALFPSSSAPGSREVCCLPGGDGTLLCCAVRRL